MVFYDAWPIRLEDALEVDVFTPHYQTYYRKEAFPRDNQNPIPIPFLAVKRGIAFEFAIAASSNCREREQDILDKVKTFIAYALRTFGIGAKTGANYGYFV